MAFAKEKKNFRRPRNYENISGQHPIFSMASLQLFFMQRAVENPELSFENTLDYLH